VALAGLAEGHDVETVRLSLVDLHPQRDTFPAEVLLGLAADALDEAGPTRDRPIDLEGATDRVLAGLRFRRAQQQKLRSVMFLPPTLRAGVVPDLLEFTYWWDSDDLYAYALYVLAVYLHLVADRLDVTVAELTRRLAARHAVVL
jgi:hypothetical protein